MITTEKQAWFHKFIGYDFAIKYKLGKDNLAADALSRVMLMAWSEPHCQFIQELKDELQQNEPLIARMAGCTSNTNEDPNHTVRERLLY